MSQLKAHWTNTIDWNLVEARLKSHKYLSQVFTLRLLQEYQNRAPYYVHPLTRWLHYYGVNTKEACERLDKMIKELSQIEGWNSKRKGFTTVNDNLKFWTLLFEIEITYALHKAGFIVKFIEQDNTHDISAIKDSVELSIEVTSLQKRFYDIFEVKQITEVELSNEPQMIKHGVTLDFDRHLGIRSELAPGGIERLLANAVDFVMDESRIKQTSASYPVIIYEGDNLNLVANGDDPSKFEPAKTKMGGAFDSYLENFLTELQEKKRNYQQLKNGKGIKIVWVNTLFIEDMQLMQALPHYNKIGNYSLPEHVDAMIIYANSINKDIDLSKSKIITKNEATREKLISSFNL